MASHRLCLDFDDNPRPPPAEALEGPAQEGAAPPSIPETQNAGAPVSESWGAIVGASPFSDPDRPPVSLLMTGSEYMSAPHLPPLSPPLPLSRRERGIAFLVHLFAVAGLAINLWSFFGSESGDPAVREWPWLLAFAIPHMIFLFSAVAVFGASGAWRGIEVLFTPYRFRLRALHKNNAAVLVLMLLAVVVKYAATTTINMNRAEIDLAYALMLEETERKAIESEKQREELYRRIADQAAEKVALKTAAILARSEPGTPAAKVKDAGAASDLPGKDDTCAFLDEELGTSGAAERRARIRSLILSLGCPSNQGTEDRLPAQ